MTFLNPREATVCDAFIRDGFVIAPAEDRLALARMRTFLASRTAAWLNESSPGDEGHFLDSIAHRLKPELLNDLRVELIAELQREAWFRAAYFACGRNLLETLVGNELAMQRGVGLSIQLPNDASSLLPLHSDVWSEDSPFEAVLWIPLVDCFRTKSMFLLPPASDVKWRSRLHEFQRAGADGLFDAVAPELQWLDVRYGEVLIFTHTLMHGNRVNVESSTRWSMNVRFKSLFSPYADKQLGDFFEPILIRPVSRIGLSYELPGGFGE